MGGKTLRTLLFAVTTKRKAYSQSENINLEEKYVTGESKLYIEINIFVDFIPFCNKFYEQTQVLFCIITSNRGKNIKYLQVLLYFLSCLVSQTTKIC